MTTPFTLLDDALMARMAGGTLVPFEPGPVVLPHGQLLTAGPDLPANLGPFAPGPVILPPTPLQPAIPQG